MLLSSWKNAQNDIFRLLLILIDEQSKIQIYQIYSWL